MKNKVIWISLVIFCLIIILPPIIHGYIYPNLGDDTARHLNNIERMNNGGYSYNYEGFVYIGVPLLWFAKVNNISDVTLFMWFNSLILIFVGLILFFILSKLTNWKFGLLALVIPIFVAGGIIEYAYWGVIFNLINIAVLIPLLFYLVSEWLVNPKVYLLISVGFLTVIASTFHTTGIYLPFAIILALIIYLLYGILKHNLKSKPLLIGLGILCVSVISMWFITPQILKQPYWLVQSLFPQSSEIVTSSANTSESLALQTSRSLSISFVPYIMYFITLPILGLLAVAIYGLKNKWKEISLKSKIFIFGLLSLLIVLGVAGFGKVTNDPTRQQVDFAIILSLVVLVFIAWVIKLNKNQVVMFGVVMLLAVGLYMHLPAWFSDNSAVKDVDKQTIEYINALSYKYYDCSSQVAFWIYDDYAKPQYQKGSDLLIVRNIPMTPGSTIGDAWFDSHGTNPDSTYKLDKTFTDDKLRVDIYERITN